MKVKSESSFSFYANTPARHSTQHIYVHPIERKSLAGFLGRNFGVLGFNGRGSARLILIVGLSGVVKLLWLFRLFGFDWLLGFLGRRGDLVRLLPPTGPLLDEVGSLGVV